LEVRKCVCGLARAEERKFARGKKKEQEKKVRLSFDLQATTRKKRGFADLMLRREE